MVILGAALFGGPNATPWLQVVDVFAAVVLCGIIGMERELRRKSAGLRTHATVGLAAAVIMIVSKYGFSDVLGTDVILDPSRVAAQIVTGIGFVGAGLIFVRRDAVKGLTTAASVWLSAAVGMACGADLLPIAAIATAGYLVLTTAMVAIERHLPQPQMAVMHVEAFYHPKRGVLREVLRRCVAQDFVIIALSSGTTDEAEDRSEPHQTAPLLSDRELESETDVDVTIGDEAAAEAEIAAGQHAQVEPDDPGLQGLVQLSIGLRGGGSTSSLLSDILSVPGVVSVAGEPDEQSD